MSSKVSHDSKGFDFTHELCIPIQDYSSTPNLEHRLRQMWEARPDVMYEKIAADTMMEKESWRLTSLHMGASLEVQCLPEASPHSSGSWLVETNQHAHLQGLGRRCSCPAIPSTSSEYWQSGHLTVQALRNLKNSSKNSS